MNTYQITLNGEVQFSTDDEQAALDWYQEERTLNLGIIELKKDGGTIASNDTVLDNEAIARMSALNSEMMREDQQALEFYECMAEAQ